VGGSCLFAMANRGKRGGVKFFQGPEEEGGKGFTLSGKGSNGKNDEDWRSRGTHQHTQGHRFCKKQTFKEHQNYAVKKEKKKRDPYFEF